MAGLCECPQISMKNGRSKLPGVSLMLPALITPTKRILFFHCSRHFTPRFCHGGSPTSCPFLRFNFGRYTFKASSEFPVPAAASALAGRRGRKHRRLLGIVLNTPREKGTKGRRGIWPRRRGNFQVMSETRRQRLTPLS